MPLFRPDFIVGDNMLGILNTTVPSIFLKKKLNEIAYYQVREAMAVRIMGFSYIKNEENVRNIATQPLINENFFYSMKWWSFRVPEINK
jgi:hypothetical protein